MNIFQIVAILLSVVTSLAVAKDAEVYQLTVAGNDAPGTSRCAALGDSIGPTLMAKLGRLVPGLSDYTGASGRRRYLKHSKGRELQVKVCTASYCSKPANYDYCYYSGCKCSCGKRRLIVQGQASGGDIRVAREALMTFVANATASIPGCILGVTLSQVSINDLGI
ncbi:hypothetical protein MPSEU_000124200 [Mayamaea pseudoterrestris]|nr:hypothetical protein MPSEU_000124200 [Mayamaea pseudoterrestris]